MSNKDANEIRVPLWAKCFFVLFLFALFAVAAIFVYKYYLTFQGEFFPTKDRASWGTFGDFFGGMLNPIFGLASFLALLATIFYQSKELKASTKELKHSAEALTKQNRAIELQSFEQTFFSWLNTYRGLLSDILGVIPPQVTNSGGRLHLFELWHQNLSPYGLVKKVNVIDGYGNVKLLKEEYVVNTENSEKLRAVGYQHDLRIEIIASENQAKVSEEIQHAWVKLYKDNEYKLDSFFRTAYKLLTWIDSLDSSRLNNTDKWLYISIFRSQLSWIEMIFFFYNGLSVDGEKFKPIIEKYALFDNLNLESDVCIKIVQQNNNSTNRYADEAFSSDLARKKLGI